MPKVDFRTVFTVMFFDEDKDFVSESQEIDTYENAENVGIAVLELCPEIAYFSVERYFKKVVINEESYEDDDEMIID